MRSSSIQLLVPVLLKTYRPTDYNNKKYNMKQSFKFKKLKESLYRNGEETRHEYKVSRAVINDESYSHYI